MRIFPLIDLLDEYFNDANINVLYVHQINRFIILAFDVKRLKFKSYN